MKVDQCLLPFDDSSLIIDNWRTALFGRSVDERGDKIIALLRENSNQMIEISYNHDDFKIYLDGQIHSFEDYDIDLISMSPVIVDLTTVGFIETLYLLKAAKQSDVQLEFIYCEPKLYQSQPSEDGLFKKQFVLSTDINNFNSVPGFTSMDELHQVNEFVFLAGYEANRIEAAFEYKENINGKNSHMIFGVPAYNVGWEVNSFFNNINIIASKNINGSISYNGASDVYNTYKELERIRLSINNDDFNLCILPFANKPSSLAAALFLVENVENTSVLYDHPLPAKSRSTDTGNLHVYKISW